MVADHFTGLSVTYFRDLNWITPASSGIDHVVGSDSILQDAPFTPNVPFSAFWSGYLFVPQTSDYTFSIESYGEVSASLGPVVGRGESAAAISVPRTTVHLDQGAHAFSIAHSHAEGLYGLDIDMAPAGKSFTRLDPAALSRRPHGPDA